MHVPHSVATACVWPHSVATAISLPSLLCFFIIGRKDPGARTDSSFALKSLHLPCMEEAPGGCRGGVATIFIGNSIIASITSIFRTVHAIFGSNSILFSSCLNKKELDGTTSVEWQIGGRQ